MDSPMDRSNVILLPEAVYVPKYRLQPAEPLTLPSDVNWAEIPVPAARGCPFKEVSAHTLPVRSPPLAVDPEPQAASTRSPAHNPIANKIFFIIQLLRRPFVKANHFSSFLRYSLSVTVPYRRRRCTRCSCCNSATQYAGCSFQPCGKSVGAEVSPDAFIPAYLIFMVCVVLSVFP